MLNSNYWRTGAHNIIVGRTRSVYQNYFRMGYFFSYAPLATRVSWDPLAPTYGHASPVNTDNCFIILLLTPLVRLFIFSDYVFERDKIVWFLTHCLAKWPVETNFGGNKMRRRVVKRESSKVSSWRGLTACGAWWRRPAF